jgi:hypothetical protein
MRASTLIAFATASLVAAAPTSAPSSKANDHVSNRTPAPSCKNKTHASGTASTKSYGDFYVNDFVFGCTSGCYYSFTLSFTTDPEQFSCSGSLSDKSYVACKGSEKGEGYSAYIDTTAEKDILKLQYTVTNYPHEGTTSHFYGEEQVWSATGGEAEKQKGSFSVNSGRMTRIA